MNRRLFLYSAAGGALALSGGAAAFALTRTPEAALRPWAEAGLPESDPRLFVARHAVLAPNPHNRQPWILELTGPRAMTLWCDLERRLPMTDPLDRQIVIGLGCFTELAAVAATAVGHRLLVAPFPEGDPAPRLDRRPIAHFTLEPSREPVDPLFAHIATRRSTKRPFDMARPVPAEAIRRLAGLSQPGDRLGVVSEAGAVERLRALTWQAWQVEAATARTHKESVDLMRIGRAEIEANPDGIALGGAFLETLALAGQLSRAQMLDPNSSATRQGHDMYRAMLAATPAYFTMIGERAGRAAELEAGRLYARANLTATALGLSLHPVSQALQEFPEMAASKQALEAMLGARPGERVHMLARLGYGPATPQTPRWAASTRIRSA